ncbi:hypothetical protein JXM67_06480 [candidate division WOR-3 bacterium]|nr:hypothetical protein [candidate division WOR-3 bacterium]
MAIPPRRTRVTSSTRPIIIAFVVLIGLIVTFYMLKRKEKEREVPTDTLKVTVEGYILNNQEIGLEDIRSLYPADGKLRKLHVWFDPDMDWGDTWEVQDTLRILDKERRNLTVTGLLDEIKPLDDIN